MTESLSSFENVPVGKKVQYLDVSPQFQAYSGVEIIVSDDTAYFAGNRTGRVLQIENAWGTQAQANAILADLTRTGFQYQPYTAQNAILNPAAELGDAVTVNGTYSGIYKMSRNFSSLMDADIEAPQDEEIDHEYPYEPKQDRIFKREIAEATAQIGITQDQITAEVTRASAAEGNLSTRITQTANSITSEVTARQNADNNLSSRITQTANSITSEVNARKAADTEIRSTITQTESNIRTDVVSKKGGKTSTFGWNLTDSDWTVSGNGKTIFKVTNAGAEVVGKITATSGYIGDGANGFTITSTSIYNGMTSRDDSTHNGVYIGTNGIGVGKGNFRVGSDGNVSIGWGNFTVNTAGNVKANNMTLTGTLNIGGTNITAAVLRSGAQSAYNNGGTWSTGAGYGYNYNNATKNGATSYPAYFKCGQITVTNGLFLSGRFDWGSYTIGRTTIKDYNGVSRNVLSWQ